MAAVYMSIAVYVSLGRAWCAPQSINWCSPKLDAKMAQPMRPQPTTLMVSDGTVSCTRAIGTDGLTPRKRRATTSAEPSKSSRAAQLTLVGVRFRPERARAIRPAGSHSTRARNLMEAMDPWMDLSGSHCSEPVALLTGGFTSPHFAPMKPEPGKGQDDH